MVNVVTFHKKRGEEFLTGDYLRHSLVMTYVEAEIPVTATLYGENTFFSLWVSSRGTEGFKEALAAQHFGGWLNVEEMFEHLDIELSADEASAA